MWSKYGKAIIAALFLVWTVVAPLLTGDGKIQGAEWFVVAVGVANALLTYIVPLDKRFQSGKTFINAVLAGLAAAQTVIGDGLQPEDWSIIIGAALAVLLGWYAPALSNQRTTEQVKVTSGFNA